MLTETGCAACGMNTVDDSLLHRLDRCRNIQHYTVKRHDAIVMIIVYKLKKLFPDRTIRAGSAIRDADLATVRLPGQNHPLKPDIVMIGAHKVDIIELTVPYDGFSDQNNVQSTVMDVRYAQKMRKYEPLRRACEEVYAGRQISLHVIVVSSLGFIHKKSISSLEKILSTSKKPLVRLLRYISNAAIIGSYKCFKHLDDEIQQGDEEDLEAQEP